jgi:hypothetical protein
MKVAVINFSGNTGKSTVAKHLIAPRLSNAEFIAVESLNSDEGDSDVIRGKQFGQLQEQLLLIDSAVVDVGASNVEDFIKLMREYRGSHDDFDLFIVPAVKDSKQIRDTIATIRALASMGVPAHKIRVVFNKVDIDETVEEAFYPLFAYYEDNKAFTLKPQAAIQYSELYQKLRAHQVSISDLLADKTDYKAMLNKTICREERSQAVSMISMRRLAISAKENLDAVFHSIVN